MKTFSFPPISNLDAKILILGTMPGKTSLKKNEYYGYKHNTFWKIIFDIFNTKYTNDYNLKTKILVDNNISLWDTLKYCYREGSLDSEIKEEVPNDFKKFLKEHKKISTIIFNGQSAGKFYKKYIGYDKKITYYVMPSTSPANASIKYSEKLNRWNVILKHLADE